MRRLILSLCFVILILAVALMLTAPRVTLNRASETWPSSPAPAKIANGALHSQADQVYVYPPSSGKAPIRGATSALYAEADDVFIPPPYW